ncbi:hypothetical protein Tco_0077784 [Tanacetum coccineum]
MSVLVTAEKKTNKKNDVKARSLLLMALPNEHQLTFNQYPDAKTMFAAIETRFGGNEATKKTQKTLLKQYLPFEWNTHVVVWMNKPEFETMSIDDLYNNFKIVEQKVKKFVGAINTASPNVNTASPQVSTAMLSDNAMYAFMVENPNGFDLLYQDLEQIHKDDLEAMDLKWQLSLLSMRAKRECRAPRSKEGQFRNQDNTRKQGNNEDTTSKAMLAIDGVGFDWSDMAEEQVQTNIALMAFSDSEVYNDKTCSKTCLKNYKTLKKQCDDLIVELNQTEFTTTTYKIVLATLEEQLITYKKNEVLFSKEVAFLKREVACKDYEINVLKTQLEAKLLEEERLARKQEEEANIALIESWENTQAMMEADRLVAERLQTREREELTDEEKGKLFMELMEKRRKYFATLRAQEKRNIPPTKAQKRSQMSTYLKHMGGYKQKQLKGKSYDEIEKLFDKEMKRVNTFVAMSSEAKKNNEKKVEGSEEKAKTAERRVLVRKEQEKSNNKNLQRDKKMKDDKETDEHKDVEADDTDELKKHLVIVKDDEIALDAIPLATKP